MSRWTIEDGKRHLQSIEPLGMRFGLERMRALMDVLGNPQRSFEAIHVVGSNGKSSTTWMIAAILREHGLHTGAYLSPHLSAFNERVRIDDEDLSEQAFADALQQAAAAATQLQTTPADDDRVTQFELLTAAAYLALAQAGVAVAVIEAGLGGRHDATNVLDTAVAVLTNVSLEHTRWLGTTIAAIAAEKLAVVVAREPPTTLVVGADLHPDALALARAARATFVQAPAEPPADVEVGSPGAYQRTNFALAIAAAQALHGPLDRNAVRRAAASTVVPGRFELVDTRPATILDGAHSPGGIAALLAALDDAGLTAPLHVVMAVLNDKNAQEMLELLIGRCAGLVFTMTANRRTLAPQALVSLNHRLGGPPTQIEPDPHRALATARRLAGPDGLVVATGTLALVGELLRQPADPR